MKLKSLLFSLFSLLALSGFSADAIVVNGIAYKQTYSSHQHSGDLCYITERPDGQKYEGDIVIPERVNLDGTDCLIVGVGDNAFKDCKDLTSVTFQGILEWIGNSAFEGCTNLNEFTIPPCYSDYIYQGNIEIGSDAFRGCHLTTLISKIAIPPYYDFSNPSNNYTNYGSTTAGWFKHDYDDRWFYDNKITLYVPAGSLAAYSKKSKDEQYNDDIYWGSDTYRDWGNLIDNSIKEIKETGVDEDDFVPDLYAHMNALEPLVNEKQACIINSSLMAYYFLMDYLIQISEEQGRDFTELRQKLDESFSRIVIYDYDPNYGYGWIEKPVLPSLYEVLTQIKNIFDEIENQLLGYDNSGTLAALRMDYYKARSIGDNNSADALKEKMNAQADEVNFLIKELENILASLNEEEINQESAAFIEQFQTLITGIQSIAANGTVLKSRWFTTDGRQLIDRPMRKGLYIRNGKKIIVK